MKDKLLNLLSQAPNYLSVAIITTASAEWKEKNKHAISAMESLRGIGFKNVEFIDIEFEDPNKLKLFDVIYINGGNPFHLLYHLKRTGADKVITELVDIGVIIVGVSGGGVVLGPDINIVDYLDKEANVVGLEDLKALGLTDIIIYPHYKEEMEEKIQEFENVYGHRVERLSDDQAVVVSDVA